MSESPFNRHGRAVAREPRRRRLPLYGGKYETPFLLAHRAAGEWRLWRHVVDSSGAHDPFDLRRFEHDPHANNSVISDLGLELPRVVSASPELTGPVEIVVEDVSVDAWFVSLQLEGEQPGEPLLVTESRLSSASGPVRFVLRSEGDRHWLELEIQGLDHWLIMWLWRETPLGLKGQHTNGDVSIPLLELGE